MRRLLLTAVALTATTSALAGIPAEVTVDSGKLTGYPASDDAQAKQGGSAYVYYFSAITIATERGAGPLPATLAFFDDAYQQLLKGGANQ